MQLGFFVDQTRCTGCLACIVACKDWNDVPAGPANWRRITTIEKGIYPDLFVAFLPNNCYHCAEPACIAACPVEAISKRKEDGIVVVDRDACIGCKQCLEACPYEAPQFGVEKNATMQKCDLCLERWIKGKKPICVDGCPMQAIDAGPIEELRAKYGGAMEAEGFKYSEDLKPSVVFKPKKDMNGLTVQKIEFAPYKKWCGSGKGTVDGIRR